ncbi:hypothetical protein G9A89_020123 [Geosiphon pyriformis]|nr:hypothetical protein G9A89_020123 [Geosiphon pyriformis]
MGKLCVLSLIFYEVIQLSVIKYTPMLNKLVLNSNGLSNLSPRHIDMSQLDEKHVSQFTKIKFTDPVRLDIMASAAFFAREAACLKERVYHLEKYVWAKAWTFQKQTPPPNTPNSQLEITIAFKTLEIHYKAWALRKAILVPYEKSLLGAQVDEIYYLNWIKVKGKVLRNLLPFYIGSPFPDGKPKLTFTGFGGSSALAIFAALALTSMSAEKPIVVTFGQPKIGNQIFASLVNIKLEVYRVTHFDDIIPAFPKSNLYSHVGTEFWIPKQENCECFVNSMDDISPPEITGNFPEIYICPSKENFAENPECNAKYRKFIHNSIIYIKENHMGPYFGFLLGQCPKESASKY